jgi:CHAT domain-containing protein
VLERAHLPGLAEDSNILVVANPGGWSPEDLPPLPGAQRTAEQVAEKFGVHPLLGEQAIKSDVLAKLPHARVIFMGCHGHFDEQTALLSGLYLARTTNKNKFTDRLTVREIMQLRLGAGLVVLAACQSGRNRVRRGDELMGLARAFLYAGASSVIVALWSVSERSATDLMLEFFDRLYPCGQKTTHAAHALQGACLTVKERYGDIFDWGPFVVVGDWK